MRIGKHIPTNDNWQEMAPKVMEKGLLAKFTQNASLKNCLVNNTASEIAEASPYDRYWGIGLRIGDQDTHNKLKWKGENQLGNLLKKVKSELK